MKLIFKNYDNDTKIFQFLIEINQGEQDQQAQLNNALLKRQQFFNMYLQTSNNKRDPYTVSQCDRLDSFLWETKKCFLDAGITPANWQEFIGAIESATHLDLSLFKQTSQNLDPILKNEYFLFRQLSNTMLGSHDQATLKRTRKAIQENTTDYKSLLKIHFPMDYERLKTSLASRETSSVEEKKSDPLLPETKNTPIDYKKAFTDAYARDYAHLDNRQKKLMTLFKAGSLDDIRQAHVTLNELWSIHDTNFRDLLDWAYINQRQTVADYCYNDIVLPFYQNSAHRLDVNKTGISNTTVLFWAIDCRQSKDTIGLLLQEGANIKAETTHGVTLLYCAAARGYIEVVKALLEKNADVNKATTEGATPLCVAAEQGHIEVVKALLEKNADVNKATTDGATPLFLAAQNGQIEVVKALLEKNAEVNKAKTKDGATPLYIAAEKGHIEVVKALLEKNADVNKARTTDGVTPLYIAAEKGHIEVVKALLEKNADVNKAATTDGVTPLYIAAEKGHIEVVKALLEKNEGVNKATTDGVTPLYVAAQNGQIEVVKALLEKNADVNKARTTDGATPLYIAAQNGYIEVVKALLEKNADVNKARTTDGVTPLCVAAHNGHIAIVQILAAPPPVVLGHFLNKKLSIPDEAKSLFSQQITSWANEKNDDNDPLFYLARYLNSTTTSKKNLSFEHMLCANMLIETSKNKSPDMLKNMMQQITMLLTHIEHFVDQFSAIANTEFIDALKDAQNKLSGFLGTSKQQGQSGSSKSVQQASSSSVPRSSSPSSSASEERESQQDTSVRVALSSDLSAPSNEQARQLRTPFLDSLTEKAKTTEEGASTHPSQNHRKRTKS